MKKSATSKDLVGEIAALISRLHQEVEVVSFAPARRKLAEEAIDALVPIYRGMKKAARFARDSATKIRADYDANKITGPDALTAATENLDDVAELLDAEHFATGRKKRGKPLVEVTKTKKPTVVARATYPKGK